MDGYMTTIALFGLGAVLKGSVVTGAALVLARFLGAGRARARFALVLGALVAGTVLGGMSSVLPGTPQASLADGAPAAHEPALSAFPAGGSDSRTDRLPGIPGAALESGFFRPGAIELSAPGGSAFIRALAIAWVAGAMACAFYWTMGWISAARAARRSTTAEDSRILAAAESARTLIGYRGRLRLLHSNAPTPYVAGTIAPAIFLPVGAADWENSRLEAAMLHETAHVKRGDIPAMAIARFALLLAWVSPLAWLAYASLKRDREEAADRLVLDAGLKPSAYATILLGHYRSLPDAARIPARACGMIRGGKAGAEAERRIGRILSAPPKTDVVYRVRRAAVWACALAILLAAGSVRTAFAQSGTATPAKAIVLVHPFGPGAAASRRITLPYGMTKNPITGKDYFHEGVDIAAPMRMKVLASGDGRVLSTGSYGGYGKYVFIDHGPVISFYAHLDSYSVKAGEAVKAGQAIGESGSSGVSTGPHLHFEIKVGGEEGESVDPAAYVPELRG
jgi:murein DD-endopeptidase MepM/ murein hydrolase activator NlpD